MHTLKTASQLVEAGLLDKQKEKSIQAVIDKFSVAIPPQFLEIMQSGTKESSNAIYRQCVPDENELDIDPKELTDPIGDSLFSPVKGIVHRYPDRCLLMPILSCPIYCRFCFRREKVGKEPALSENSLKEAYAYIANHKEIWEVILTGGDPFILKPKKIAEILKALNEIPHVEVVRIHTRVPVVDSKRISKELVQILQATDKAIYVVLHANHPSELTDAAIDACRALINAGIPMLSHTVLLKDINDNSETLEQLMRTFVKNRIKPYYLHHPDLAKGTSHFRVSIQKGQQLVKSLHGKVSGLCQPTYVLDLPGGHGKVPIRDLTPHKQDTEKTLDKNGTARYAIKDYQGNVHLYEG